MTAISPILLIDGDTARRRLTAIVIQHAFPDTCLVEAGDASSFAAALADNEFSIVIAAPDLPWQCGTEALREVKYACSRCSTILFGAIHSDTFHGQILRGAVDAVLRKSSQGYTQLPTLIRTLHAWEAQGMHCASGSAAMPDENPVTHETNENLDVLTSLLMHDLQQPLGLILQDARQLSAQFAAESSQLASRQLQRITTSAERIRTMIDGLKSRAEAAMQAPLFEAVDLNEVLQEVMHHLDVQVAENNARILHAHLPEIVCDRRQMMQLIENLISNSLKFRGEQPPRITVQVVERASEWLFSVSDNGIGIEAADSKRVFGIFQRLHTAEEYPGTGMGLAICQRIALRHEGDIWMQPNPGGGTSCHVSIKKRTVRSTTPSERV